MLKDSEASKIAAPAEIDMNTITKVCDECGLPLDMGLANCLHCGHQVGTLFSELDARPDEAKARTRKRVAKQIDYFQKVDQATERANSSLMLALASFFFPVLGILMAIIAIVWGAGAASTLKKNQLEEGRGPATAALAIGALGLVAQFCYLVYFAKMGVPFLG